MAPKIPPCYSIKKNLPAASLKHTPAKSSGSGTEESDG